jgi:hypothetical protein
MSECDFKVYTNCGCSFPTVENCEWCRDANHIAAVEKLEADNKALREKVARVEAESLAMLDASGRR